MFNSPNKSVGVINGIEEAPEDSKQYARQDGAWSEVADGGKVLQVVQATYGTQISTNGTTNVTTNLSASITPSSTANKVLVLVHINSFYATGTPAGAFLALYRDGSPIVDPADYIYSQANHISAPGVITHLDSPSSTSSLSYEVYFSKTAGSTAFVHDGNRQSNIILMEIAG